MFSNQNSFILVFLILSLLYFINLNAINLLDLNEIDNYKYNLEILNEPKLNVDQQLDESSSFLSLTTIHGQPYQCNLTSAINNLNEFEAKTNLNQNYNFTYVNEQLNQTLKFLKNIDKCIYKNQGWWTYEFCYGENVTQYHLLVNGTIEGEIISLGSFKNEFNWLEASDSKMLKEDGKLYHEEYYDLGSLCEISGQPRRATVKFYCNEKTASHIEAISEIETCVYDIHVHTSYLCSINGFDKKTTVLSIQCNPVLNEVEYSKYMEVKAENQRKLEEEAAAKKLVEQVAEIENEPLKEEQEVEESANDVDTQQSLETESLDVLKNVFEKSNEDEATILDEIDKELSKSEDSIQDLKHKTQIFEDLLKQTNNMEISENVNDLQEQINGIKEDLMESTNNLYETDEILKKLSNKLYDIIDNLDDKDNRMEDEAKSKLNNEDVKIKVSVIDTKMKLVNSDKKNKDEIKKIEDSIKEELLKKNKKFKDVEIKVFNLQDGMLNNNNEDLAKMFNSNMDNGFVKKIINSIFGTTADSKKYEDMKNNYNLVFKDGKILNLDKNEEVQNVENLKGHKDDSSESDSDGDDDNSLLIRF